MREKGNPVKGLFTIEPIFQYYKPKKMSKLRVQTKKHTISKKIVNSVVFEEINNPFRNCGIARLVPGEYRSDFAAELFQLIMTILPKYVDFYPEIPVRRSLLFENKEDVRSVPKCISKEYKESLFAKEDSPISNEKLQCDFKSIDSNLCLEIETDVEREDSKKRRKMDICFDNKSKTLRNNSTLRKSKRIRGVCPDNRGFCSNYREKSRKKALKTPIPYLSPSNYITPTRISPGLDRKSLQYPSTPRLDRY